MGSREGCEIKEDDRLNIYNRNDSKKADEKSVLIKVILLKNSCLGKSANKIINWLEGESINRDIEEEPDFVIRNSSDITGIELFQVSAHSTKKKGKMLSIPDITSSEYMKNSNCLPYNSVKANEIITQMMKSNKGISSSFLLGSSFQTFKSIFENKLTKVKNYKEQIRKYGSERLVLIVKMSFWDFSGLTAVGKKTFECDLNNIPLCKDIVDIVAKADDIDAVVLLFNQHDHNPTVFAFTPYEAKNNDIGVEVYEYIGYDEVLEKELTNISINGVCWEQIQDNNNFNKLKDDVMENCRKVQEFIRSGLSYVVPTYAYEMLANNNPNGDTQE